MNFTIKIREYIQHKPDDSLIIVDYETVTLEVARYLGSREDKYGIHWAPVKQYFIEIHQDDSGPLPDIRSALNSALDALHATAGSVGVFTLWIKGRRYSQLSCSFNDADKVREEMFVEVDSDMAFNREEWGLTKKQRQAKSEDTEVA